MHQHNEQSIGIARFVRNGLPDGYVIRLATMEERHFPTATRIIETTDGGIDVRFDCIHLDHFPKGQFLSYWPVVKERPRTRRRRVVS
jgi:hypothetical protein